MGNGIRFAVISIALLAWADFAAAGDWVQWGGTNQRNMVSPEKNLPGAEIDLKNASAIRWTTRLGLWAYGHPVIADGRVFIGTGDRYWKDPRKRRTRGGLMICLDEASGKVLWRLLVPRYREKIHGSAFDDLDIGICSTPTVEGERVYVVSNRGEVLCLDTDGLADGNDGPFRDEGQYMAGPGEKPLKLKSGDGDIIWRFDMIASLPSAPHDATNSSVMILGDYLYVCTSNGVHRTPDEPNPLPDAPSLIVLDKKTGKLVGVDGEKIGRRTFHGQWSSPAASKVGGKTLVYFGAGDGVLYAFEQLSPRAQLKPPKPTVLKKAWWYDCNPPEFRKYPSGKIIDYWDADASRIDVPRGFLAPSEIIATPVVYKGKIYIAIGRDPEHGPGKGVLHCIDPRGKGDITKAGRVWSYSDINRTMGTVAISAGLLYVADIVGTVHCLEADTGKVQWVCKTGQPIWSSTLVADGKVYACTEEGKLWIFKAGRKMKVLVKIDLPDKTSTMPTAANGVLYFASHRKLYAIG